MMSSLSKPTQHDLSRSLCCWPSTNDEDGWPAAAFLDPFNPPAADEPPPPPAPAPPPPALILHSWGRDGAVLIENADEEEPVSDANCKPILDALVAFESVRWCSGGFAAAARWWYSKDSSEP